MSAGVFSEHGLFVCFEGGEGAGKSTQARLLAGGLSARGLPVLLTREPGGSPGAEAVRELLLGAGPWDGVAETMLHFAARREHVARSVGPALDAAFASDEPNLIEVITDPDAKPPLTFFHGHHPEPF